MVEKWWNDGGAMSNNMKFFPQKQFVFVVFDSTPKPVVFGYFWASRCSANTDRTAASKDMPTSRQHRRLVSTCPLVVIFLAKTHRVGDWCICKQRSFPAFPAAASGSLKRVFGGSFQSSLTFLCTWKNKKRTIFWCCFEVYTCKTMIITWQYLPALQGEFGKRSERRQLLF